ncbi:chitobiase/beta-hexosaminidase C-terminal domain-containing protein [Parasporobacterium paucivorans]|uniref:Chitobiase/beta-hexosaminidase C-terminal domain-containing protein n=1 Tax=Parasporobacterium paucivorans DSM 15970 TaxID=1122934 RepID=A0A1M6EMC7_9FIRM|nr:chitobiase/beta-hexosaminidase C-terminal domain-containing protein [Parasporobacterium paucivorans]SHI86677.1 Chitobiase/beta-hexosaminidase C-terminal domain-containing protein [Parasporobacterium paucivorans DSM 15970]
MKCSRCGEPSRNNQAFCKKCGSPLHIAPDFNIIEAELADNIGRVLSNDFEINENIEELNKMDNLGIEKVYDEGEEPVDHTSNPEVETEIKHSKIPNKKKLVIISVIAAAIIIAIVIISVNILKENSKNTFEYRYSTGMELYGEKAYSKSLTELLAAKELAVSETDTIKVNEGLISVYEAMGDKFQELEKLYLEMIDLNPGDEAYYISLVSLYSDNEMYAKAQDFINGIEDEKIYKAISSYGVIPPSAGLKPGVYNKLIDIELISEGDNVIYYTVDGTEPSSASTAYTGPISIKTDGQTIIKAVTMSESGLFSKVTVFEYSIQLTTLSAPVITPASGTYSQDTSISISAPEGAKIYYTYDGSTPDANSSPYTGPIKMLRGNNVFQAIAISEKGVISPVVTNIYDLKISPTIDLTEAMDLLVAYLGDGYKCEHLSTTILKNDEYYIFKAVKDDNIKYYGVNNLTGEIKNVTVKPSGKVSLAG